MFRNWLWLAILLVILCGGRAEARQASEETQALAEHLDEQLELEIADLERSIASQRQELESHEELLMEYTPQHSRHAAITEQIAKLTDELGRLETALEIAKLRKPAESVACIYVGPHPALDTDSPGKLYREQLAELDLLVTVDRDFAEAERRLGVLRLRAMGPPAYEGQREVVILATARLAEVQLAQRAPERALDTVEQLLIRRPVESLDADEWFTPAKPEWIEREQEWLQDGRLLSLRELALKDLERRAQAPTSSAQAIPSDVTDEIWRNIQEGDGGLVEAMGTAAVPALEQLVVRSIENVQASAVADYKRDPLYWLMNVAPTHALELMRQHVEVQSIVWRKRMLRAMNMRAARWPRVSAYEDRRAAALVFVQNPVWQALVDTLAADLALWEDTKQLLSWSAEVAEWTPAQAAVVREVMLDGRDDHFALLTAPGRGPFWQHDTEAERDLLRDALLDARPEVRAYAAERLKSPLDFLGRLALKDPVVLAAFAKLSRQAIQNPGMLEQLQEDRQVWVLAMLEIYPSLELEARRMLAITLTSPELREAVNAERLPVIVNDPDPGIRLQLFERFKSQGKEAVELSEREYHLLRAMIRDSNPDVRAQVASYASSEHRPARLDRSELLLLAADESPSVRRTVAYMNISDAATRSEIYALLGSDSDVEVVQHVDAVVRYRLREELDSTEFCLPYFQARLANPDHPALDRPEMPKNTIFEMLLDPAAFQLAARFAREHPAAPATRALVEMLDYLRRESEQCARMLAQLPADDLAHLLKACAAQLGPITVEHRNMQEHFGLAQVFRELHTQRTPDLEQALITVSEDREAHTIIRLHAFAWRMAQIPDASEDAAVAFLCEPLWEGATLKQSDLRDGLGFLSAFTAKSHRNSFALKVIESPETTRLVASEVTDDYLPDEPGGIEVSRAMLKRWLAPDTEYSPASAALRHLGGIPGEVDPELLRHALKLQSLRDEALMSLAKLKDPQFLPDLQACLNPTWIGYHETRHDFAKEAAFVISQYMTDEAAEVLLEGVVIAETEDVRQACFDALERIRLYQEARERIARHSSGAEKREQAVRELVEMLDDSDQATVVAAVRGLAALGAVDELPTLIRLMKHSHPDVRDAATEAVARLTEPVPETGGTSDER